MIPSLGLIGKKLAVQASPQGLSDHWCVIKFVSYCSS
jgi:hypothetical protein